MPDIGEIPDALRKRERWLLWSSDADDPRRPHWRGDFGISWNDPEDWRPFQEAVDAASERDDWGIGFVFTEDLPFYAIDIDGPYDVEGNPREWLPDLAPLLDAGTYAERSPGHGIHVLVPTEPPEWWSDCEVGPDRHEGVDCLINKFCTVTGARLEAAGSEPTHVPDADEWLLKAYRNIRGELPRMADDEDVDDQDDEWSEDAIEDALEAIDPDLGYNEWIRIGFAVHDWDPGSAGKRLFRDWSRSGSKWDDGAQRTVDHIWDRASQGQGVTVGTLVYEAQEAGWQPSSSSSTTSSWTRGAEADAGASLGGLSPDGVAAWHALGEDESIEDLNDRQRAAAVWDLLRDGEEYHVRVRDDNGEIWSFDGGIWEPQGERSLGYAGREGLGPPNYGQNVLRELQAQARGDVSAAVDGDEFGLEAGHVAVENGLLDLEAAARGEDALYSLEPDHHALARLPVSYEPSADATEWRELVEEWAEDGRADALQEYVGYCLHLGEMPVHRALLLVGSGANGKGVFLRVVRELLGRHNTTAIGLQTLANEEYAVAEFHGAIANIDDDLSARKLGGGAGMFKKLVAGDQVRARRPYQEPFDYHASGKHLYAANQVPDVKIEDTDEAFWRRWLLVEFPNYYPPADRDPGLGDRLVDPDVLSGVLNWAIEGWARLLEQGHFTNEELLAHQKRERWQAWGDSVEQFISECVERDEDAPNVSTSGVYDRYSAWCRDVDEQPGSQKALTTALKSEGVGYAKSVRTAGTGSPTRGFKSLRISDDVPELDDRDDRGGDQESLF